MSGLAVASLIASIAAIFISGAILSFVGAILGHMAMRQIKTSTTPMGGQGLALAGIIIGWICFAIIGIPFLTVLLVSGGTFFAVCCSAVGVAGSSGTQGLFFLGSVL